MGAIETELTKATGFKPPKGGFKDRRDELAALAKAAYKLDDDSFDEVTDEAADWVNLAIKAINDKADIPEPDDGEPEQEAPAAEAEEAEEETEPEEDEDGAAAEAEAQAEAEAEEQEAAQEVAAKKPEKAEKQKKPKKPKFPDHPPPLPRTPEMALVKTRYDNVDGSKDRFGVMIGTKTHDAVQMYERGATTKEIQDKLGEGPTKSGGRFYNILKKLSKEGHLVERSADGVFKLTHRDDLPDSNKPEKPRKTRKTRPGLKKPKPSILQEPR